MKFLRLADLGSQQKRPKMTLDEHAVAYTTVQPDLRRSIGGNLEEGVGLYG